MSLTLRRPSEMIVADGAGFPPEVGAGVAPEQIEVTTEDARIEEILTALDLRKVDWSNPLPEAMKIAQHIETLKDLKGKDKLILVQSTLRVLLSKSGISQEEQSVARRFVDDVLPHAIHAAVLVSKGEFSLQKVAEVAVKTVEAIVENPEEAMEQAQKAAQCCVSFWGAIRKTQ